MLLIGENGCNIINDFFPENQDQFLYVIKYIASKMKWIQGMTYDFCS